MKRYLTFTLVVLLIGLLLQTSGCSLIGRMGRTSETPVFTKVINNISDTEDEINGRKEYYSSVMAQKQILSEAFFSLDNLIKDPKPKDQTWNFQVNALLVKIQKVIEEKYGKTCPAVYNDANIEYSKALDAFQYFVINYPKAIENMNSELLATCSEKLKLGYQSIDNVGKTLEAIKE